MKEKLKKAIEEILINNIQIVSYAGPHECIEIDDDIYLELENIFKT